MKTIDQAVRFNNTFKKFHEEEYLHFAGDYIQVTHEKMAQIIREEIRDFKKFSVLKRNDRECPFKVTVTHKDTVFLAIGTRREFGSVGIIL